MKPRHQIKFGSQLPKRFKQSSAKANATISKNVASDVVQADVIVGERELRFARALSDTEKRVRELALSSLREWLTENASKMNTIEMDRLWKGLFYCLWMADKRPIITLTIGNVVDLADIAGWPFLEALFTCVMREWFGIDRYRVDKFYELVSRALSKGVSMTTTATSYENFAERLGHFIELLSEKVWLKSRTGGVGVALHVLDLYVDQVVNPVLQNLNKLGCGANRIITIFNSVLEDVFTMMGARNGWMLSINNRIREQIVDRLPAVVSNEALNLSPATQRKLIDQAAKRVFKVASDKKTSNNVREPLYSLHIQLKAFVHKHESRVDDKCSDGTTEIEAEDKADQEDKEVPKSGAEGENRVEQSENAKGTPESEGLVGDHPENSHESNDFETPDDHNKATVENKKTPPLPGKHKDTTKTKKKLSRSSNKSVDNGLSRSRKRARVSILSKGIAAVTRAWISSDEP